MPKTHATRADALRQLVPSNTAPESFAKFSGFHRCGLGAMILL
jgi:hypothetical protein